jgi:hypothetical protein
MIVILEEGPMDGAEMEVPVSIGSWLRVIVMEQMPSQFYVNYQKLPSAPEPLPIARYFRHPANGRWRYAGME